MKIYTKTGDNGTTSLVGGERVDKCDLRVEAYGTIDELTAQTAYLRDNMYADSSLEEYNADLSTILNDLMLLASHMACSDKSHKQLPPLTNEMITFLEQRIDIIQQNLPAVTRFTIPGGHPLVSLSHICRTVCRRAERCAIRASKEHQCNSLIIMYLNRLSDYFYILGRKITNDFNVKEEYWL